MARMVVQCPLCEHKESVISTSLNALMPPCPRCADFVRMKDVTPDPNQKMVISTAGSQSATPTPPAPIKTAEAPAVQKRRDSRDFGPEPRA